MRIKCSVDEVKRLQPKEVEKILEGDRQGEFIQLDVRQPEEYEAGHIPGSRLIPLGELEIRYNELERDKKIITYCRSGHRSMGAAILLCGLGFKGIYVMDGGMLDWNYEILKGIPEGKSELIRGKEGVGDVLVIVLKLESGSYTYYLRVKENVRSKKLSETLQRLAEFEEKHMEKIYNLHTEKFGKSKIPSFNLLKHKLNSKYMEGGIEVSKVLLERKDKEFGDEIEVLEAALEKEYISYDFYKRTAAVMGDTDARALLHELAGEERDHINILLNEIKKLVGGK